MKEKNCEKNKIENKLCPPNKWINIKKKSPFSWLRIWKNLASGKSILGVKGSVWSIYSWFSSQANYYE